MRSIFKSYRFAVCVAGFGLGLLQLPAAPLTWFPGPAMNVAVSGAATAVSGLGNLVIGGESYGSPSGYVESLVATNNVWTAFPGFPYATIAPGVVGSGDPILVFGGNNGTSATSAAYAYSPSGDPVPAVPSMNVARAYLGYTTDAGGNAYAIGGLDDSGNPLASAEVYNQDTTTNWSYIASLPEAQYNFPATFDGKNYIYIFGGRTNTSSGTEITTVLRYSVSANTWAAMAPMPIAVAGSSAAFGADGKIYVVGGTSGGVTTNVVQVYNPGANSWTISTPLPEALSASAMGVDSLGRLIVMGGSDVNSNDVADVWRSQQLGTPDSPPVLTQFPGTNAAYGVAYTSTIAATGNPQPVYVLVSGPTNLTVDYFSGQITWTPSGADQIGAIPVTIAATNYAGSTNWTFTINAAPPPPVVPTNLTVVAVDDTSVTLAWDPESPLVGPVTYVVYWKHSSGGPHPITIYTPMATNSSTSVTLGLTKGSSYAFVVTASANGHTTGYSQAISVTATSPQPPTNLHVAGLTSTTLTLAWDASPGPAQNPAFSAITSYSIAQYIPVYGGYSLIYKVTGIPTTTLTGTVTGLAPGHVGILDRASVRRTGIWVVGALS